MILADSCTFRRLNRLNSLRTAQISEQALISIKNDRRLICVSILIYHHFMTAAAATAAAAINVSIYSDVMYNCSAIKPMS